MTQPAAASAPPLAIIFNPVAGRRRAQTLSEVLDALQRGGVGFELLETKQAGDAVRLAREAAAAGCRMCVAAGGDGTVADTAKGLLGSSVPLGIMPLGTANVLAHELRLPFAPHLVAEVLARGRTLPVWPGMADGATGRCMFLQMLSAGFDAQVVHNVSLPLKRVAGRGAYVAQVLRELPRYGFKPIRLRLDGVETAAANVIVSKGRLYGGNFLLAPAAEAGQQGFSVAMFDWHGRLPALLYGMALPMNLLWRAPGLRIVRAQRVELLDAVPVQADGDAVGLSPLRIADAETPIQVVVA